MKLNKIRFARVIGLVTRFAGRSLFDDEMLDLDAAIDIETEQPKTGVVPAASVNNLLMLMAEGKSKIEAIKAYRHLTGEGLKESNDAVERYWISRPETKQAASS